MEKQQASKHPPKTAVIGACGFLGSHFLKTYRRIYPDCIGTQREENKASNMPVFDLTLTNVSSLHLQTTDHKDALIVAGISDVSKCEAERLLSHQVNVDGVIELIRQLADDGIKPIFISSDYVFDGVSGHYADDAPVNPINEYGRQKTEIEAQIGDITAGNYLVLRLSKVFSLEKDDGTLLDEMASTLVSGRIYSAAYDQIFCPLLVSDLMQIVLDLQRCYVTGVINVCSNEVWSRYDLALVMANALAIDTGRIAKIRFDELCGGFVRPHNTSMQIKRLTHEMQCVFTPIRECVKQIAYNYIKSAVLNTNACRS